MHILNFIIALLFFFLIFSLFTSWVVEYVAQQINLRGVYLDKKLRAAIGSEWLDKLFEHPLLSNFRLDKAKPADSLDPNILATAITAVVLPKDGETIKEAISKLPDGQFREILSASLDSVEVKNGQDLNRDAQIKLLEGEILSWVESYNKKISQWYKNLTRKYLFVVGLIVAISFNVDVLHVGDTLWKDAKLSEEIASSAETFLEKHSSVSPTDTIAFTASIEDAQKIIADYQQSQTLPIGWGDAKCFCSKEVSGGMIFKKILGYLLAAFTVTLGAPFWYDALRNVIDIKSMVKPKKSATNNA